MTALAPVPRPVIGPVIRHSGYLTMRWVRETLRQPWYVAITLVQPMIWLLLFGQLFRRVVDIPGFNSGGNYMTYLAPGVVVMTALFSSGWCGTSFIDDMDRGVMDRLLVTPVSRTAMIAGALARQLLSTVIQTLIVIGVAIGVGARFDGGVAGVVITIVCASLLTATFASYSNALALLTRRIETLIGIVNFLVLPLSFLSSAMMDLSIAPSWMRAIAQYNPVNWAAVASREALGANPDWTDIFAKVGGLLAVAIVFGWFATRAFRSYQRSV